MLLQLIHSRDVFLASWIDLSLTHLAIFNFLLLVLKHYEIALPDIYYIIINELILKLTGPCSTNQRASRGYQNSKIQNDLLSKYKVKIFRKGSRDENGSDMDGYH